MVICPFIFMHFPRHHIRSPILCLLLVVLVSRLVIRNVEEGEEPASSALLFVLHVGGTYSSRLFCLLGRGSFGYIIVKVGIQVLLLCFPFSLHGH